MRSADLSARARAKANSRQLALLCAEIAAEKKARDIVILDIHKLVVIADYFVVATGDSSRQLQAIAEAAEERLNSMKLHRLGEEGYREGKWILLDYGSVIVHLFLEPLRKHYDLENLWADAPRVRLAAAKKAVTARAASPKQKAPRRKSPR